MGAVINLEIEPGTAIERASEDACRVANVLGIAVEFTFNNVTCFARPGGLSAELAEAWNGQMHRELEGPLDRRFAMTGAGSAGRFLRATPKATAGGELS